MEPDARAGKLKAFCDAGDLLLETVGAVRGGEYVWALARINDAQIEVDGDTLKTSSSPIHIVPAMH